MEKQWLAKFINLRKRPIFPFAVGFGIACAAFPIAYTVASEWTSNILTFLLMVPGLVAYFALQIIGPGLMPSFLLQKDPVFVAALVSSFFYGSMGGVLASNKRYVKLLIFPLIFLLILLSSYMGLLLGLSD